MIKVRKIELLAPAKNFECGIAAIDHGADAIYIGAPKFGARAAAGNTIEDIQKLAEYAHLFNAKVYVALNTILSDRELEEAQKLIHDLYYEAKVDALIVQDMGILMLDLPPIPLHASTQTDNRNVEKIKFLETAGFQQIVLARELTIDDISKIASEVKTPLEVFVHGALCVCYSGQCYLSQVLSGRSANKGTCAQYCRLPYSLIDSDGEEIVAKKHLLSMKDLNLSEHLEELMDAGVSSLKIEGRLKDVSYVKNVVAYYRKKIDKILARRSEYTRSSSGVSTCDFIPDLYKSFNRGFTEYFLHDRIKNIWSIDSPKSLGEPIGKIIEVTTKFIRINATKQINNGDGLCFFNSMNELEGTLVNRVEGDKIFSLTIPQLKTGTSVYRNYDHEFEKQLEKKSAERKIRIKFYLKDIPFGFSLEAIDEDENSVIVNFEHKKELANKDQHDNIVSNLKKTGNTLFGVEEVVIDFTQSWFIPSSLLSEWRRAITDKMLSSRKISWRQDVVKHEKTDHPFPTGALTYLGNVMNEKSRQFYMLHQTETKEYAMEKCVQKNVPLMFTRHCIKQAMGWCPKEKQSGHPYKEPFFLKYNNTCLQLEFDCKKCEMKVFAENK